MIKITKKEDCCGCEACVQACPQKCISFVEDKEGFLYPLINETLCVRCGKCTKICPILNPRSEQKPISCVVSRNIDEKVRLDSSSGGAFSALAERIIDEGGIVFGAIYDNQWNVCHSEMTRTPEMGLLRTSKYVQSRIGDSFIKAKQYLDRNVKVLFSGTSCQIAGLRNFLNKDYENLYTIDVICHGVPSPLVWKRYMKENSCGCSIVSVNMRDKFPNGWTDFHMTLRKKVGDVDLVYSNSHDKDAFMQLFLNDVCLRPSCYKCPAKGGKSGADITLADFWGAKVLYPDKNDEKGMSLVITSTSKGARLVDGADLESFPVEFDKAIKFNSSFYKSKQAPFIRRLFFYFLSYPHITINNLSKIILLQKRIDTIKRYPAFIFNKIVWKMRNV